MSTIFGKRSVADDDHYVVMGEETERGHDGEWAYRKLWEGRRIRRQAWHRDNWIALNAVRTDLIVDGGKVPPAVTPEVLSDLIFKQDWVLAQ